METQDEGKTTEVDTEQLQSAIDMSMSLAFETVTGWMINPPALGAAEEARRAAENKEFEELAFRLPRLGVGATPPVAGTSKDAWKLRNTLTGKKRKREDEDASRNGTKDTITRTQASDVESDEDSRVKSLSTKPKSNGMSTTLLPFEPATSKKKKKKKKAQRAEDPSSAVVGPLDGGAVTLGGSATPKSDDGSDKTLDEAEEWGGILPDVGPPPPSSTNGFAKDVAFTISGSISRLQPIGPVSHMNETPRSSPTVTLSPPSSNSTVLRLVGSGSPPQGTNDSLPTDSPQPTLLLNGHTSPSKKKRKGHKKRRKEGII